MELATIRTPDGATQAAVRRGDEWMGLAAGNLSDLLARSEWSWEATTALSAPAGTGIPAAEAELGLPFPSPRKVICCGLNYADHILEMGRDLPEYPTLFAKFADTLTGPHDDIAIPAAAQGAVDWEAELAVVVGSPLTQADDDEARAGIAGYLLANDISMRDWQKRTLQWFQGKAFDRTTPTGPALVTADDVDPEDGIEITCEVNGVRRQLGSTKTLVFDAAALLAYISQFTALRPGDIVLTGTPGGVGMGMQPPQYLTDGDTVVVEAAGLGRLENTIRFSN
jgi:acylpyruvate hydrolase